VLTCTGIGSVWAFIPDDPELNHQWYIDNYGQTISPGDQYPTYPVRLGTEGADIHAEDAWGFTRGSSDIVIALIDSGVNYQDDLQKNDNGADWDFVEGDSVPQDEWGHGTADASIIAAITDNGVGIAGIAPKCKLMNLRVLDKTGKTVRDSDLVDAVNYANQHGADIIVFPIKAPDDPALKEAMAASEALIVVSAGNALPGSDGTNNDVTPHYPGSWGLPNVISVAGTTNQDKFWGNTWDLNMQNDPSCSISSCTDGLKECYQGSSYTCVNGQFDQNSKIENDPICAADCTPGAIRCDVTFSEPYIADSYSCKEHVSNYGATSVEIGAPAENIRTLGKDTSNPTTWYSGTSQAAAIVGGVAALVKSEHPELTNVQIKQRIMNTVDPLPELQGKVASGGRVNAYNAILGPPSASYGPYGPFGGGSILIPPWPDSGPYQSCGISVSARALCDGAWPRLITSWDGYLGSKQIEYYVLWIESGGSWEQVKSSAHQQLIIPFQQGTSVSYYPINAEGPTNVYLFGYQPEDDSYCQDSASVTVPMCPVQGETITGYSEIAITHQASSTSVVTFDADSSAPKITHADLDMGSGGIAAVGASVECPKDIDPGNDLTKTSSLQEGSTVQTFTMDYTGFDPGDTSYYCALMAPASGAKITVLIDGTCPLTGNYILNSDTGVWRADFSGTCSLPDTDQDGIPDSQESGPSGTNPDYDGNGDSVPDSHQDNVASFSSTTGAYVTLASDSGTLSDVAPVANPSPSDAPSGVEWPVGFIDYTITGLTPGGSATVTLYLPSGTTVNTYWKYGKTPENSAQHWYEFLYDGTTGAEISGNVITLHFVDGKRGDNDLTENGAITDPGTPGFVSDTIPPTISGSVSPAANDKGWNNGAVTVTFTCADSGSGVKSCPDPVTLTTEGAGQSITGVATDNAGNTASATVSGINIDLTPPVITITVPKDGAKYAIGQVVKANYAATDALSGIATVIGTIPSGSTINTAKPGPFSFCVTATENAGNTVKQTNNYLVYVPAKTTILPKTINLAGKGAFIAVVKLPAGYPAANVDKASVQCNGAVAKRVITTKVLPQYLLAVFRTSELKGVSPGNKVTLTVSGNLKGNLRFEGSDTVKVIQKGGAKTDELLDWTTPKDDTLLKNYKVGS